MDAQFCPTQSLAALWYFVRSILPISTLPGAPTVHQSHARHCGSSIEQSDPSSRVTDPQTHHCPPPGLSLQTLTATFGLCSPSPKSPCPQDGHPQEREPGNTQRPVMPSYMWSSEEQQMCGVTVRHARRAEWHSALAQVIRREMPRVLSGVREHDVCIPFPGPRADWASWTERLQHRIIKADESPRSRQHLTPRLAHCAPPSDPACPSLP